MRRSNSQIVEILSGKCNFDLPLWSTGAPPSPIAVAPVAEPVAAPYPPQEAAPPAYAEAVVDPIPLAQPVTFQSQLNNTPCFNSLGTRLAGVRASSMYSVDQRGRDG